MVGHPVHAAEARRHAEAGATSLGLRERGSPLSLYLDSSALAKLFLDEPGSREVTRAVEDAGVRATSRLSHVECGAAFARARRDGRASKRQLVQMIGALDSVWPDIVVVELDERIARAALAIARDHPVRAADAIQLASALTIAPPAGDVTFACFDRRSWDAAGALGLDRLPADA